MTKSRGHFCWCCGRIRPNERFSGAGHARHVCKDCTKLGAEELTYRQAVRDIDHMLREPGRVKRRQKTNFAMFLRHPNEGVRRYAESVAPERLQPEGNVECGNLASEEIEAARADDEWIPPVSH